MSFRFADTTHRRERCHDFPFRDNADIVSSIVIAHFAVLRAPPPCPLPCHAPSMRAPRRSKKSHTAIGNRYLPYGGVHVLRGRSCARARARQRTIAAVLLGRGERGGGGILTSAHCKYVIRAAFRAERRKLVPHWPSDSANGGGVTKPRHSIPRSLSLFLSRCNTALSCTYLRA